MMEFFQSLTIEQKDGLVSGAKLGSVWIAVGVTSWADVAALLAAGYSFLLICEFLWKKVVRPAYSWWRQKWG